MKYYIGGVGARLRRRYNMNSERRINIDGIEFMPVEECPAADIAEDYVLVRTQSAGVFVGYIKSKVDDEITLSQVRRIWKWSGAASLSQLAMEGTSDSDGCKFPCEVISETIKGWIEIIPVTETAKASIAAVPVWSA